MIDDFHVQTEARKRKRDPVPPRTGVCSTKVCDSWVFFDTEPCTEEEQYLDRTPMASPQCCGRYDSVPVWTIA